MHIITREKLNIILFLSAVNHWLAKNRESIYFIEVGYLISSYYLTFDKSNI